jgi:hypothetical protein
VWILFKVPHSELLYLCLQVIRRKKEEISSGNKKYIESSVTPEEKSVTTAFKSLKDDLDEQDENDVGKPNVPLLIMKLSYFPGHRNQFILRHSHWFAFSASLTPLPHVTIQFPRRALVFYPEARGTYFL